jgi:hypothetical protein
MQRPSFRTGVNGPSIAIVIAALAALVAVGGCALGVAGARGAAASPSPAPVVQPDAPAPTAVPFEPGTPTLPPGAPEPTPVSDPTVPVTPAVGGVDGAIIPLDVFLGHDVKLAVSDVEGLLTQVSTGQAADGMSVRWGEAVVRNLGPQTVEVVWEGLPQDEVLTLVVRSDGDRVRLRFGQQAPPPYSDAMGADRVVVLTFAKPVDASDVIADVTAVDAAARIGRPVQAPPTAGRITRPVEGPAIAGRIGRPVQGPAYATRITRPVQGPVFA